MYFKPYAYNISSLRKEVSIFRVHIDMVASQQQLSCNPLKMRKSASFRSDVGRDFWLLHEKRNIGQVL